MALWLELIPKIHRSDQLERRFHLLDDYDNETTFERDGTRQLLLDEPFIDDWDLVRTTTSTSTSLSTTAESPMSSSAVRQVTVAVRRTSTSPRPATTPRRRSGGARSSKADSLDVVKLARANVPLSVTVAVGCTLLLLNVVVFVVVCRQKRRARLKLGTAARFRSRDELKHGGGVDTESAGFDSNHSSLSSYSLAASVQHADYGRCRNVRFCEARPPAAVTSQDGGSSALATRRLPARSGRENEADECLENEVTMTSNHFTNPSTTV